jgi:uncharacterized protein with HEPN domain
LTADADRLRDMVEHLDLIEEHAPSGLAALQADVVRSSAILRWLEIVGEAAANVSEVTRLAHPEIPWREIIGMRNRLIHAYPDVNLELVWAVVDRDGPRLRRLLHKALEGEA